MKKMMTITVLLMLLISSALVYTPEEKRSHKVDDILEVQMTNEEWESDRIVDEKEVGNNHQDAPRSERSAASTGRYSADQDEFGGSWFDGFEDESGIKWKNNVNVINGKVKLNGWIFKRAISIQNGGGLLTNYPVLITFDQNDFDYERADQNGDDLRFYNSNRGELNYWIEKWNDNGQSKIWVNVNNIPNGNSEILMFYGNPKATCVSNALLTGIGQLREHRKNNNPSNPDFSFSISDSTWLKISSTTASASGNGFVLYVMPKDWLDGKYISWNWKGYYSGGTEQPPWAVRIYDGIYLRTESSDFPDQNPFASKGSGQLQQWVKSTHGSWGPETIDAHVNLSASSENYVTIFLWLGDGWAGGSVWDAWDWFEVNTNPNGVGNLVRLEFNKNILMEVTGTYNDYGLYRKYSSPEPSATIGAEQQNPAPYITSIPINITENMNWDSLSIAKTELANTYINISIINNATNQTISGYENRTEKNIDISNITTDSIRLKASFSGDGQNTPTLDSWGVEWTEENVWRDSFMGDGKCIGAGAFEADEHTLGLWHFNENYRDSSKNTNDGTPNGDVHFIESKYGQGAYFNGNGDYIDCGNDVSLQIRGDITIEAWVNMGSPNGLRRIVSKDDLTNRNYYLHTLNGVPFVGIFQSGMELKTIGTTDLRNTGWRYIVGVNDGTNLMIYVDGILEKSEVKGGTIDNDPVNFLVGSRGGTEYFNGIIDEVRISNVARNPEEIRQTYQAGIVIRGGQAQLGENEIGPGPGSVGYWSFDEGRGDKAYDGSGNGNDGAVKGAEWVEGIHGYALDFSGEDDVIDLPDSDNLLGIIKDFTIHARIPHNGYSIGGTILNLNYISVSSDRGNGIIFSLGGTSIPIATFYLEDDIDGKMYTLVGDKSLEPMSLNLVTLRKEHTILSLYLNGIEINSIQVSDKNLLFSYDVNTHTGDYNSIGKYHHQNGDYAWPFNGIINEISVFNHAQTPREIYNHSRLYRPNATLRSETVTLPNNHTWDIFQFTRSIPENTFLNISVHDARTNDTLFNISGNDAKGYIDLSSINVLEHSSIYLQAYFQSNRTQTPVIYDWAVNWTPIIQPTLKDEIKQIPIYEETLEVNILNLSDYFYDEYSEIGPTRYAIQNISNNNLTLQLNHSILDVVSLVENFTGNVSVIVNCTNIYNRTTSSNPFNITVINIDDIPIWRTIPEITMIEDEEYITNWSLDGYIFDAEKDECGFSVRSTTKKLKINITADYRLLIVPVNNFHGRANIGIRAFEISNTSLYGDVNISIYVAPKNDAPFVTLLSPGNNTTINDIDVTFNWQVLDVDDDQENITFDLYLGESDPPGVYLSDITTSSMTIRNLEDGATYYWYIKPSDGKIAGLCLNGSWSFNIDTKIYVPEVTLHSPLNGSVLNSMEANLTWEAVNPTENELMFNIYVGTSKEGLSLNGTTKGNRYLLGSLKENTTYYWKVIPLAETLQGKCTSGTWHFSVNTTFEIFYNITVEIDIEELEIVQGENASFNITLINYGNVPTLVELSGSGIIYGILDLPKTVTLQKGESHKVLATINRTSSIYPDLYELNLEITYLGGFESFVIPVNITSAYKPIVDDNESETVKRSSDPNLLFYIIGITVLFVILAIGAFLIIRKKRVKEEDEDDDELNGVDIVKPEESPFIKSSQPSPPTIEQQSQPFSPSVKHSSYLLKTERAVPGAFTLPPQPLKEGEQSIENILSGIKTGKPLASPPPPSPQSPPLGLLPQATDSTTLETPPVPLQPVPSGPQIVGIDTQFSVSDIFLIYVDGRLVKSVSLGTKLSEGMDEDIMSGMLTAITDFIKDSFSEESGALKTLQYGKMAIYLERGVSMYLAVVFHGHPPHNLREKMRWLLIHLWETYKIKLKVWDGSYDGLDGLDSMLTGLMGLTEPAVRGTAPEAPMVDGGSGQATISTVTEAVMCGICMGVVKPGLEIMMCYCSGKYHRACGERIGTCPKCNTLLSVPVEPPKTMIAAPREEVPLPAGYMPPPPEEILNDDTKYLPEYSGQKAGETGDLKIDV